MKFLDLLQICTKYFGNPRINGSHHIFKIPWQGDPRINIQKDGNMAKEYQVKSVAQAIGRLEKEMSKQIELNKEKTIPEENKPKEKKHGEK